MVSVIPAMLPFQRPRSSFTSISSHLDEDDVGASLCKSEGHVLADASRGTGAESGLAFQGEELLEVRVGGHGGQDVSFGKEGGR